jgi:hypothetical protein
MSACMLFNVTKKPHNQTPFLDLLVLWKWVQPTFKPNIQNLTNIFHLIYFQLYAWKCIILVSSLNTFKYWVFLTPITTLKNNVPFEYLKKPNTISQDWKFEHKTFFLNIDSHTCNHSSMVICTRLTFNYRMMFNEGHLNDPITTDNKDPTSLVWAQAIPDIYQYQLGKASCQSKIRSWIQ